MPRANRSRDYDLPGQEGLPELHVTIGRDRKGSGLTITAWEPTRGLNPSYRTLYAARWAKPIDSTQELLEVTYRGIAAALAELYDLDVTR
jgi:hypothetical protein